MTNDPKHRETPASASPAPAGEPEGRATWLHSLLGVEPAEPPSDWRAVGADRNDQRSAPARPRVPVDGFGLVELGRSDPKPAPPPKPAPAPPTGPFSGYIPGSIAHALTTLDPDRDSHWTSDGQARLDALFEAMGCVEVTRVQIADAWPGFSRRAAREYRASHGVLPDAAPRPAPVEPHSERRAFEERLARVRAASAEHAALERAIGRPLPALDFRCAFERRVAAQNRLKRYRADHRR